MTAFPILNESTAPEPSKALLRTTKETFGFVPHLEGVMAASPPLLQAYGSLWQAFTETTFTSVEQQIVYQTINVEHECTY
jgi:hypothetical protein